MAMIPPLDGFMDVLSAACDTIVTPAHSDDIGDATMKVAAPGGFDILLSAAHGAQLGEELELLLSQDDGGIGSPPATSSHKKTRHLNKVDGSHKIGGASGLSPPASNEIQNAAHILD